jgi:hypothetical protein
MVEILWILSVSNFKLYHSITHFVCFKNILLQTPWSKICIYVRYWMINLVIRCILHLNWLILILWNLTDSLLNHVTDSDESIYSYMPTYIHSDRSLITVVLENWFLMFICIIYFAFEMEMANFKNFKTLHMSYW